MANRTILEELVVRIVGDARQYVNMMRSQFAAVTTSATNAAQHRLDAFGHAVDRTFLRAADRVRAFAIQAQRGLRHAFLNAPMYANQAFGAMRRGLYNFQLGWNRAMGAIRMRTLMGRAGQLFGVGANFLAGAAGRIPGMVGGMGRSIAAGAGMLGRGGMAGAGMISRGGAALGGAALGMGRSALGMMGGAAGIGISGMIAGFGALRSAASSTVSFISKEFRRLGYDMAYVGRRISMFVTAPITAFAAASVKAFARFDDALQTSIAVMGGVGEGMKNMLKGTAFDISAKSRTAPSEVALSYYHLASAGYKAADALSSVRTVERFAIAGAFDLNESGHAAGNTLYAMARATNYLVDTLAAMGMKTEDTAQNMANMKRIADVLTQANIVSNATVQDFAKALTNKGAAALRLLNKDVEEGVAVLAAFASQGVKAENAGEKLYIITRDLARATLKHRQEWENLGIAVFDTSGNMKHLADIIQNMEKVLGGLSDEEKRATLMNLGLQDRSLAATIQLLGMSDAIRKFDKDLRNADGAMDKVANIRLQSFTSQMMMLKNQITIVAIGIGEILVPYINKMNTAVKRALDWWKQLNEPMQKWVVFAALGVAAVGPLVLGLGILVTTISTAAAGISTFMTIMSSVVAPILAVTAAVVGLVYMVAGTKGLTGAWEYLKEVVGNTFAFMVGFVENFSTNIFILTDWFGREWKNVLTDLMDLFRTVFSNATHNIAVFAEGMVRVIMVTVGWIAGRFEALFQSDLIKFAITGLQKVVALAGKMASYIAESMKAAFTGSVKGVAKATSGAFEFGKRMMKDIERGANAGVSGESLISTIGSIVGEQRGKMKGMTEGFKPKSTMPAFITEIKDKAVEAFEPLEKVKTVLSDTKDIADEGITAKFAVEGIEALDAKSAKFIRKFMEFQGLMKGTGEKAPSTFAEIMAKRKEAYEGRTVGAGRSAEVARRARMRAFFTDKKAAADAGRNPDIPSSAVAGIDTGTAELNGAGLLRNSGGGVPSEMERFVESVNRLTDAINLQTETVSNQPVIELVEASLEAGG